MLGYEPRDLLSPRFVGAVAGVIVLILLGTMLKGRPVQEAGPFDPPVQRELREPMELAAPEGYTIVATDEYRVEAMVMSRCRYWFDDGSVLSPIDLLLGWGPLTVEPNLHGIEWKQQARWGNYHYLFANVNIEQREMDIHSANTHIIPASGDRALRRALLKIRRGDVVRLTGYLVQVRGADGFYWNSSRTRADTGDGACELFYVTAVESY